jgi:hypothetical protein
VLAPTADAPGIVQPEFTFELSDPQADFVEAAERFPCLCAGFGAGKTIAGAVRTIVLKCAYPTLAQGYYLPTYDLVKRVGFPAFEEVLTAMGIRYRIHKSDREIEIAGAGKVIFRSLDTPARIIGYKHADAVVDELDTLKPEDAREVFRKIQGRNRQKKPDGSLNTIAVATTPEGFRFVYETWQKDPQALAKGHRLIRASTHSNAHNLPADYIPSLMATWPANLLAAYLEGLFVNLTSGSIYTEFDRHKNDTREQIQPNETLHVGMDFNVQNMAAVIHVLRDGDPHAVAERVKILDTPAMIKSLQDGFPEHPIMVYPDASGNARKSVNASESDLALLRAAKFSVCANASNPAVKDRVLAMNGMIHAGGKRRYRVSQDRCPNYVEALEKQVWGPNGEPDKSSGHDHPNDAGGYFIVYRYPIRKPATVINLGFAR